MGRKRIIILRIAYNCSLIKRSLVGYRFLSNYSTICSRSLKFYIESDRRSTDLGPDARLVVECNFDLLELFGNVDARLVGRCQLVVGLFETALEVGVLGLDAVAVRVGRRQLALDVRQLAGDVDQLRLDLLARLLGGYLSTNSPTVAARRRAERSVGNYIQSHVSCLNDFKYFIFFDC